MDEVAIMEKETVGKRAKVVRHCGVHVGEGAIGSLSSSSSSSSPTSSSPFEYANICTLPIELILQILSYLTQEDLCNMARVSRYFEGIVCDPVVWRTYEVTSHNGGTSEIIERLRKMPFLRELTISRRLDSNEILRQISLTNKNLEKLNVYNCTGLTSKFLRSRDLTCILKKCQRLHTIKILGSSFRGRKFYKLLGDIGSRLRLVSVPATPSQFSIFAKHVHVQEKDHPRACTKCAGRRLWRRGGQLWYSIIRETDYRTIGVDTWM